ncbi:MAG: GspE/PulE family protein [Candidatus Margulisbacteria bacterium]|nr:GspE/PulE family protein [Candidatus Margulisiibacteriota bacterium]
MEQQNTPELLEEIFHKAVSLAASDIHLEPRDDFLRVRYRIDGLLVDGNPVNKTKQPPLLSRLKLLCDLDIGETRLPQDGRSELRIAKQLFDLRTSILPTIHGEKAVVRLLPRRQAQVKPNELGMNENSFAAYLSIIERRQGLVLITGPTGSGKTTTLYATLSFLNNKETNIMTIEEPVEYQLPGINQVQVNNKSGLTFSRGLRSILRQDPDIIMVGEIRDQETARIAIQAALTGHQVFSTLHTNSASAAVERLVEIGIEPYLVKATVAGVVAQRLVRKKTSDGYLGRVGLFEVLVGSSAGPDFRPLIEDAREKLINGLTDEIEVARVMGF